MIRRGGLLICNVQDDCLLVLLLLLLFGCRSEEVAMIASIRTARPPSLLSATKCALHTAGTAHSWPAGRWSVSKIEASHLVLKAFGTGVALTLYALEQSTAKSDGVVHI